MNFSHEETRAGKKEWTKWGPYLSERQWGTVREDYSASTIIISITPRPTRT